MTLMLLLDVSDTLQVEALSLPLYSECPKSEHPKLGKCRNPNVLVVPFPDVFERLKLERLHSDFRSSKRLGRFRYNKIHVYI